MSEHEQYLELLEIVEDRHSVLGAVQGVLFQVPVDVHIRALVVHIHTHTYTQR